MFDIGSHRGFQQIASWVDANNGWVPCGKAVIGGSDLSGESIYIGRVNHGGDILPGKIVPSHNVCYVAYGGEEKAQSYYQALVAPNNADFVWVHAEHGRVPTGAIQGGITGSGEKLYIGRARQDGAFSIGKVQPSHSCCYIPFGGREHAHRSYEVLCVKDIPLAF